jgi:hypothetical protein
MVAWSNKNYIGDPWNFNMSTAAVFLNIEKAFDTTWHPGLLYKLTELHFSPSLIKLIYSFLSHRLFRVMVLGELPPPPPEIYMPRGSYSLYINDTPQTLGVYLALFADDTCLYSIDRGEGYVLRRVQRGLTAMESWCEHWNIKINEDKTQAIYFSHRRTPVEAFLTLKGRQIPFANHVKYLDVIFDKKISWNIYTKTITTNALCIFLGIYPILKSKRYSVGTELIIHKALIRSMLTYAARSGNLRRIVTFWNFSD